MIDILSIFWGLLGVIVSVGTYTISYKQTIGARKERAKNIVTEINKIFYRNLILEEVVPCSEEIRRILYSKLLENRIKESDLPSEMDFLNSLYTRLFEDELIQLDLKNKLILKIDEIIKLENKKLLIEEPKEIESENKDSFFAVTSVVISLFAGMLAFVLPDLEMFVGDSSSIVKIVIMLIVMMAALSFTRVILKQKSRDVPEASTMNSRFREVKDFENLIYRKIKLYGFKKILRNYNIEKNNKRLLVDFYAKKNNKNYYFEVRYNRRGIASFIITKLSNLANHIKKEDKSAKLILINKNKNIFTKKDKDVLKKWDYFIDENSLESLKNI